MRPISLVILYVDNPPASAAFYAGLLGQAPAEQSATFAMLPLPGGSGLGLWSRHTVTPSPGAAPGSGEIVLIDPNPDALCAAWSNQGVQIAQPPQDLDFGRSFVALDPDGHRLRVVRPD